jgi:hypothetical protein
MSVAGFLRAYIDSPEKLRVLMLVHGAAPGRISAHVVAQLVRLSIDRVRALAAELAQHRLIDVLGWDELELRSLPISERLSLAELAEWYQLDRGLIHELMSRANRTAS